MNFFFHISFRFVSTIYLTNSATTIEIDSEELFKKAIFHDLVDLIIELLNIALKRSDVERCVIHQTLPLEIT